MRIVVTGATGYIGQRLIRAARLAGYEVLALSRRPVTESGVAWQCFNLADTTPLLLPDDIAAVFHLAAETRHALDIEHTEQAAAQRLIAAAGAVGAGFVFVSSQTARADAPTAYGRIKWQVERATLAAGGLVIRPGQVYGGGERGLFGVLCTLVRRMPVLPAFIPAPVVQPVHVDDLVKALLACIAQVPSSVLCVAAPESVGFAAFLQALARGRTGRRPITIPVPTLLVRATAKVLGPSLSNKLGLDRLCSLFSLLRMDTAGDLQRLSLTLRPLSDGMTRSGRGRRELLREGCAFLTYVLRMKPTGVLVRRYARAMESVRTGQALRLPEWVLIAPALLALLDGFSHSDTDFWSELAWRLNTALILAEASPQGACRFLGADCPAGWWRRCLRMTRAVVTEVGCRAVQWVLWPVLVRVGRRRAFE
jgi:nucleoside-diphosphate-sugar epimerase